MECLFYCMVGLPGSGKSTMAKNHLNIPNKLVISTDELREKLLGDENSQNNNPMIFEKAHELILDALKQGKNIVFDATNTSSKKRINLLDKIFQLEKNNKNLKVKKICVFLPTQEKICLEFNQRRKRQVPEHVIKKFKKNIQIPFYFEGWDDIYLIPTYEVKDYSIVNFHSFFTSLIYEPHNNSHHTLSIGNHCFKCAEEIKKISDDELLFFAALLHDIGKKEVKKFENSKGEKTKEAHFYNHDSVSAYEAIFWLHNIGKNLSIPDILKIAFYIQYHMRPYSLKTQKAKEKFEKLIGKENYEKILLLHQADTAAH